MEDVIADVPDDPALSEALVPESEVVAASVPLVVLVVLLESPSSPPSSLPVASAFIAPS